MFQRMIAEGWQVKFQYFGKKGISNEDMATCTLHYKLLLGPNSNWADWFNCFFEVLLEGFHKN